MSKRSFVDGMTDGEENFHALVTYTKEGHKKKGKKWLDGHIHVKKSSRQAVLRDESGTTVVATGRVPSSVELCDDGDEFQLLDCSVCCTLLVVITECLALVVDHTDHTDHNNVGPTTANLCDDASEYDADKENGDKLRVPASQPACPPAIKWQRNTFSLKTARHDRILRTDAEIMDCILKAKPRAQPCRLTDSKPVRGLIERVPAADLHQVTLTTTSCTNILNSFGGIPSYQDTWRSCLEGEIISKLEESLSSFNDAVKRANLSPSPSPSPQAVQSVMEASRIPYYGSCRMSMWKPSTSSFSKMKKAQKKKQMKRKRKKDGCYESDEEAEQPDSGSDGNGDTGTPRSFLILTTGKGRLKSSDFAKGDIWIVSTDPLLGNIKNLATSSQNVWFARSLWHGPNIDGKFEIELLSFKSLQNLAPPPRFMSTTTPLVALKGPDAALELSLIDLLLSRDLTTSPSKAPPILPALLNPGAYANRQEPEGMNYDATRIAETCHLNVEQARVLQHIAGWSSRQRSPSPLCLIFGPFGCGKSSLLVAVIRLVLTLRMDRTSLMHGARVLVTAHTNTAVDRILLALAALAEAEKCGVKLVGDKEAPIPVQFLRVGPLRRIDKRLLPYSLHASSSSSSTALSELQDMLKECPIGENHQRTILESEVKAFTEAGAERRRRLLLKNAPVVGVTACSSLLPVLDGQVFDIVILDESSQMIEPLSLAPMIRSNARWLVCAGDPKQLPPLIVSKGEGAAQLARPLFVRLTDAGCEAHMLKRQYRCHPDISAIANANFYDNTLIDGCTAAQRPSLLPGFPSLVFINVQGTESRSGKSIYNGQEAAITARFLAEKCHAMNLSQCGVICFYRAQVDAVQRAIQSLQSKNGTRQDAESATVATVDGFQGAERDVIILTTAITRPGTFASDACRLNVALTRARHNLIIIGQAKALEASSQAFKSFLSAVRRMPNGYLDANQAFP